MMYDGPMNSRAVRSPVSSETPLERSPACYGGYECIQRARSASRRGHGRY